MTKFCPLNQACLTKEERVITKEVLYNGLVGVMNVYTCNMFLIVEILNNLHNILIIKIVQERGKRTTLSCTIGKKRGG